MTGLALPLDRLDPDLIDLHRLRARVYERDGRHEVQFLLRERPNLLPVWHDGQLHIAHWGSRRADSRRLPPCPWTWLASVEEGRWARAGAEEVEIPAALVLDRGVWYTVRRGVRGLLVRDERKQPHVYPICEPAEYDYEIMTGSRWQPVLIEKQKWWGR